MVLKTFFLISAIPFLTAVSCDEFGVNIRIFVFKASDRLLDPMTLAFDEFSPQLTLEWTLETKMLCSLTEQGVLKGVLDNNMLIY